MSTLKAWAVVDPNGRLCSGTVTDTKTEAESYRYHLCSNADPEYGKHYWKQWNAGQRAAKRRGWRIVRVIVTEAP